MEPGGTVARQAEGDRVGQRLDQVLGVVPTADGASGMPRTNRDWEDRPG